MSIGLKITDTNRELIGVNIAVKREKAVQEMADCRACYQRWNR